MALALEGVKVLDVSQVAAVPMAARLLADFGADVIHVEHPKRGDSWRDFQAGIGEGYYGAPSNINYNWENLNRNKRSLTVDLSKEMGREIIYSLSKKVDIFLTNLRPYEKKKFGLEYEILSKLNPRLIYASLTGYGKKGPEADAPGYDMTAYVARAGISHRLSFPGMPPVGFCPHFGDHVAAFILAYGVMVALYTRDKTGMGQEVDVSLLHSGIYHLSLDIAATLITGKDCDEWKPGLTGEDWPNPLVSVYETSDGRWLRLNMTKPKKYWPSFCQAIGHPELEQDPKFATLEKRKENRSALYHILKEVIRSRTLKEWRERLKDIPHAPIQNLLEVVSDPQAEANEVFVSYDHPEYGKMKGVANPVNLSKTPASVRRPAPKLGEHTEEVLLEYGFTREDIASFKEQEVI